MDKQSYTLATLANLLAADYRGDAATRVSSIAPLDSAQAGQISFLDNPKYRVHLAATEASIVILTESDAAQCPTAALIVAHPYYAYAKVAECFQPASSAVTGIHPTAVIGEHCEVAASASIGAHVVLGEGVCIADNVNIAAGCVLGDHVHIGADSCLYANVSVYRDVHIGQRVIIHSGAVLGSDGFGFAKHKGSWHKVPQLGNVQVHDDVEIGANTSIDRGALGDTIIAQDVKLDNQVQIGHNVTIGAHTAIAGCVGIAGTASIGEHCLLGGGVGVAGHLSIADNAAVTGFSGVTKTIHRLWCILRDAGAA